MMMPSFLVMTMGDLTNPENWKFSTVKSEIMKQNFRRLLITLAWGSAEVSFEPFRRVYSMLWEMRVISALTNKKYIVNITSA